MLSESEMVVSSTLDDSNVKRMTPMSMHTHLKMRSMLEVVPTSP